jgi:hypothetical protein
MTLLAQPTPFFGLVRYSVLTPFRVTTTRLDASSSAKPPTGPGTPVLYPPPHPPAVVAVNRHIRNSSGAAPELFTEQLGESG